MSDTTAPYDVAVLMEQALSELDARQLVSLHEGLDVQVRYHLLLPADDSASTMATSLGMLGGDELALPDPHAISDVQTTLEDADTSSLTSSQELVRKAAKPGTEVTGALTHEDPVRALTTLVSEVGAAEVIILTTPHVLAEFFHTDWASRAERRLDVPTLHLIEHETFDGQSSGAGEGASLI